LRVMGLDFGSRTCGVAMSDELLMTAQPVETIHRDRPSKIRKTLARIEELIETHNVGLIVLGLPLNMNDTQGERAAATLEFRDQLTRRTGLPVVMSDERLTTVEADELLDEMGIAPADRKTYLDTVAANIILQEYMENHREEMTRLLRENTWRAEE